MLGTFWSLAQPFLSGADESMHYEMAQAVYRGYLLPKVTAAAATQFEPGLVRVRVPTSMVRQQCFVAKAAVPASCSPGFSRTSRMVTAAVYTSREPLLPSLLTGLPLYVSPFSVGFYLSRGIETAVSAALLATAVALALSRRRPLLLLGVVLGATPSVVAEIGVLGSSQLEIGAMAIVWVSVALLADGERATRSYSALVTAASVILLMSRPISFVYMAVAAVVAAVVVPGDRLRRLWGMRRVRGSLAVIAAAFVGALAWYEFALSPPTPDYIALNHLPHLTAWGDRISATLAQVRNDWIQAIGASGYNEYNGPWYLTLLWTLGCGLLSGLGLLFSDRRRVAALAFLWAVLLLLPIVAQSVTMPTTYLYWQGRYDLPTLMGILVLSSSSLDGASARIPELRRLAVPVIVGAGLLQAVEFLAVLRRYAVGVNGSLDPLAWVHGWSPPIPMLALLALGVVSILAAYGGLSVLARCSLGGGAPAPPTGPTTAGRT